MNPPNCAISCLNADYQSYGCNSLDVTCLCNSKVYISNLISCIVDTCNATDALTSYQWAQSVCNPIGVTLSLNSYTSLFTSLPAALLTVVSELLTATALPSVTASSTTSGPKTTTAPRTSLAYTASSTTFPSQTPSPSPTPSPTTNSTSLIDASPSPVPASAGLSQSGVVTIGVVIPLVVIIAGAIIGFLLFRRRRRATQSSPLSNNDPFQDGKGPDPIAMSPVSAFAPPAAGLSELPPSRDGEHFPRVQVQEERQRSGLSELQSQDMYEGADKFASYRSQMDGKHYRHADSRDGDAESLMARNEEVHPIELPS